MLDNNILQFRRQYLIAPKEIDFGNNWILHKVGEYCVYLHPELNNSYSKNADIEILCLGFFIDYHNPLESNLTTINRILEQSKELNDIILKTYSWTGRWLLFIRIGTNCYILNDVIGSRQFFYSFNESGMWGASQPHIIANILGIERTQNTKILNYIKFDLTSTGEVFWINDATQYDSVRHLQPNHYISLHSQKIIRFWPTSKIQEQSLHKVTSKSKFIFQQIYKGLADRFELMQAITAGWDSRVLLAASKPYRNKIKYYIQTFKDIDKGCNDVQIASKIGEKFKLDFEIINCDDYDDKEFTHILKQNISILHNEKKMPLYYCFYTRFPGKLNISGFLGEIPRLRYGKDKISTAAEFADKVGVNKSDYVIEELQKWIDKNKATCESQNILLTDLYYWEMKMGNWGAQFPAELDIAIEEIYPFNCRDLLILLISPKDSLRTYYNPVIYIQLIKQLWAKLLMFPINRVDPLNTIRIRRKNKFFKILKKIFVYSILKRVYKIFVKNK